MTTRLKFPIGEQKKFLELVFEKSKLNANGLAKIVNVSPRTIRDWKREKFHTTKAAATLLSKHFNVNISYDLDFLEKNWKAHISNTNRVGGLGFKIKYGNPATAEGRRKGGSRTLQLLREKGIIPSLKTFNLPKTYSSHLAEWVGIVLGDGSITNWGQIHITLNMTKDAQYQVYVSNLAKKLFGHTPKLIYRPKDNASITYFSGVSLVNYLVSIGLKIGNKVHQQVDVPDWIKEDIDFSTACLRGLVDTDGCIATHSYIVNRKRYTYKKFVFANRSLPLINFVCTHLNKLGLRARIADKLETKYVWLYNNKHTKRYLEIVGTHNFRIKTQGG